MSGIIEVKKTAWDAATAPQKAVARMLFNELELGTPATGSIDGVEWYLWSDYRIDVEFTENLAWVMSNLADFTDSPVRDYVVAEDADPLTAAADANITASWFTARTDLPAGWVPDDGEA